MNVKVQSWFLEADIQSRGGGGRWQRYDRPLYILLCHFFKVYFSNSIILTRLMHTLIVFTCSLFAPPSSATHRGAVYV